MTKKQVKKEAAATSLVLRCNRADMTSRNGFVWPGVGGIATAADWKDNEECGNGLHGWLYGQGDHGCADYWAVAGAKWLVVRVEDSQIRMLGGKCKFQSGEVVFVGGKAEAADYIIANEPKAATVAVVGRSAIGGYNELVTVGALGSATAGASGTATAGDYGTATAGNYGTATAGDYGTATAGYRGTATAGIYGTATAGNRGTATAGNRGTATAGNRGTATAGDKGEIRICWYDGKNDRHRTVIGYVGEDGIEANVTYKLDAKNKFVKVKA